MTVGLLHSTKMISWHGFSVKESED